jgi:hypothetical protein
MSLYYTGVGSRDIPPEIYRVMVNIARTMAAKRYVLRSGGAQGSDSAFEAGCDFVGGEKEIWRAKESTSEAIEIASMYHGAWDLCNNYAKMLHGRNVFQVLGKDLKTPSEFVICYTHDGCIKHVDRTVKTGGTGTAISVASDNKIPVINIQRKKQCQAIREWLKRPIEIVDLLKIAQII